MLAGMSSSDQTLHRLAKLYNKHQSGESLYRRERGT